MTTDNFISEYLKSTNKTWAHDRTATIGASEIGQCARRVWFVKNEAQADPDYVDSRGASTRGDLIEKYVWLPALLKWAAENGATVLSAGDEQETIADGYLSATCDAIVKLADGTVILRECKSIDPRVILTAPKPEHKAQVQTQLGAVTNAGLYQPAYAVIDYIDASFVDRVTSFDIAPDPTIYTNARKRALLIMDATDPLQLRPEGKMAGGKECDYCPFSSHCASVQADGVPARTAPVLADNALQALAASVAKVDAASLAEKQAKATKAEAQEEIKELLRAHSAHRVDAETFSVSWATVKGRESLDLKAAKAAGFDPAPFMKEGDPSERLTVKKKELES